MKSLVKWSPRQILQSTITKKEKCEKSSFSWRCIFDKNIVFDEGSVQLFHHFSGSLVFAWRCTHIVAERLLVVSIGKGSRCTQLCAHVMKHGNSEWKRIKHFNIQQNILFIHDYSKISVKEPPSVKRTHSHLWTTWPATKVVILERLFSTIIEKVFYFIK